MVAKPLDLQWIMGYQWKDKIHIFHLAPISTLCDQRFGYSKGQKNRTDPEHARNQIHLQFLRNLRLWPWYICRFSSPKSHYLYPVDRLCKQEMASLLFLLVYARNEALTILLPYSSSVQWVDAMEVASNKILLGADR